MNPALRLQAIRTLQAALDLVRDMKIITLSQYMRICQILREAPPLKPAPQTWLGGDR